MERYAGRYTGRSSSQEEEVYKRSGIVSVDGIDDEYYLQGTQATRGIKGYGAPPRTAYGYQDLAMFAQRSASDSYDLQYDDNDIHNIRVYTKVNSAAKKTSLSMVSPVYRPGKLARINGIEETMPHLPKTMVAGLAPRYNVDTQSLLSYDLPNQKVQDSLISSNLKEHSDGNYEALSVLDPTCDSIKGEVETRNSEEFKRVDVKNIHDVGIHYDLKFSELETGVQTAWYFIKQNEMHMKKQADHHRPETKASASSEEESKEQQEIDNLSSGHLKTSEDFIHNTPIVICQLANSSSVASLAPSSFNEAIKSTTMSGYHPFSAFNRGYFYDPYNLVVVKEPTRDQPYYVVRR